MEGQKEVLKEIKALKTLIAQLMGSAQKKPQETVFDELTMPSNFYKLVILLLVVILLFIISRYISKNKKQKLATILAKPFPTKWKELLNKEVRFYNRLNEQERNQFEKRILLFFATKKIIGVDTNIDDNIKLMIAASAIIPMFAFPGFNYPNVRQVLIYPNSFDEKFQTTRYKGHKEFISGMIGNRFMNGTVILSKPDLIAAYDGSRHKKNVGIHEFVHLIDEIDGVIDGVPKQLMENSYVGSWLHEIKNEMHRIKEGDSDINPYAISNNAEFLAVVSEYFFDNPEKFKRKHLKLYKYLTEIFHQNL